MTAYGQYPFGLDEAAEERAARLLREHPSVDLVYQGPTSPEVWTPQLEKELQARIDASGGGLMEVYEIASRLLPDAAVAGDYPEYRELFDASGVTCGLVGFSLKDRAALANTAVEIARLRSTGWLRTVESSDDVLAAHQAGEHAMYGQCQFNWLGHTDLDLLDDARALGLVTAELAYNRQNAIGTGCTERVDAGLSNFGVAFVQRCNEVGVIVDTSHSGRATTLDACEVSERPVVATHTSASVLYTVDRSKTDEELEAIAATGGVIGIVAVPFFLAGPDGDPPTIETMLDHVDHVVRLVGWQHVAIGTDWPLPLPHEFQRRWLTPLFAEIGFREEHHIDVAATLDGFRDYRDWPNIVRGLVARGYDDDQVAGIIGGNFLRVLDEVRA